MGTSIQQIVVNQPYIQSNLSQRVHLARNRGKPTIYTVKPDLKYTSIQQIVVNEPYIESNLT